MPAKLFDVNRLRKTYPLLRVKPIYNQITALAGIQAETAILNYIDSFSETYTFTSSYQEIPIISATPEDENVNIFITTLGTSSVTIQSSAPFTGKVHLQIFRAEE